MVVRVYRKKAAKVYTANIFSMLFLFSCANVENDLGTLESTKQSNAVATAVPEQKSSDAEKFEAERKFEEERKLEEERKRAEAEAEAEKKEGLISDLGSMIEAIIKENLSPEIQTIPDQLLRANGVIENVPVQISDDSGPLICGTALKVKSSNEELLPTNKITIGGETNDCTLKLSPTQQRVGNAVVTVVVSDGEKSKQISFSVKVSGWGYESRIQALNAHKDGYYGQSVALSDDLLVVGAPQDDSSSQTITNAPTAPGVLTTEQSGQSGAVFIYRRSGLSWSQEAFIKSENSTRDAQFGFSVAVSGDTIAVGAIQDDSSQNTITTRAAYDTSATNSGAVHVYKYSGSLWGRDAYIKASNVDANDWFGASVALSGSLLAVGAPKESSNQTVITNGATTASSNNSNSASGAVYIYRRTQSGWIQDAYLKASNSGTNDRFGDNSIALYGDTLVVGALGEDSDQKTITQAPPNSDNLTDSGAAYVFRRKESGWEQEQFLKAGNAGADDVFGSSVAIYKGLIAVGAPSEDYDSKIITPGSPTSDDNVHTESGAVYLFKRSDSDSTWSQVALFKAPNSRSGLKFGTALKLSDDRLFVGAENENSNQNFISQSSAQNSELSILSSYSPTNAAGAVYVFARDKDTDLWKPEAYLKSPNPMSETLFGKSLDVAGSRLVVGAPRDRLRTATGSSLEDKAGAVYVFRYVEHSTSPESAPSLVVGSALPSQNLSQTNAQPPSSGQTSNQSSSSGQTTTQSPNSSPSSSPRDVARARYTSDGIASIISTHCATNCHKAGVYSGYYQLVTYNTFEDVIYYRATIKDRLNRTGTGMMPMMGGMASWTTSNATTGKTPKQTLIDFVNSLNSITD